MNLCVIAFVITAEIRKLDEKKLNRSFLFKVFLVIKVIISKSQLSFNVNSE